MLLVTNADLVGLFFFGFVVGGFVALTAVRILGGRQLRKAAATAAKLERLFKEREVSLSRRITAIEVAMHQARVLLGARRQKPATTEVQDAPSN